MSTSKQLPNGHRGELILFSFPESVFGRRMERYLNLRAFPYSTIRVPPNMPRPLLQEKLGVNYRRIPVLAIGRDVYIDTRLMLRKLEIFFPEGRLGAEDSFGAGIEDMLEEFIIDAGPFWRTSGCIPLSAPLVQNDVWMKDRFDGSGGVFTKEALKENRSWCISQLRLYFALLEKLLADGRQWILSGSKPGLAKPGLAEIHAGWVYDWAVNMTEAMEDDDDKSNVDLEAALSDSQFPKVHAWVKRFRAAADAAAQANASRTGNMDEGAEAEKSVVERILASDYTEQAPEFDEHDVLGLKRGQKITVSPADFGFTHKDNGVLVGLSRDEVVIESEVPGDGNGKLRLHYPRINFKIHAA